MAVPGLDPGISPGHPRLPSEPSALILRRIASAIRLEGRGRLLCALEPPSRRSCAAPQDEAEGMRAAQCSHFVLDFTLTLGYIVAQPDPTRGALREASQVVGTGTVLPAGHAAGARRPLAALCWSKSKRLKEPCGTSSSALTKIIRHRAGLQITPPSIASKGSEPKRPRARRRTPLFQK